MIYIIKNDKSLKKTVDYMGLKLFTIEQVKWNIMANNSLEKGNINFIKNELNILEKLYNNDTFDDELISILYEFEFDVIKHNTTNMKSNIIIKLCNSIGKYGINDINDIDFNSFERIAIKKIMNGEE